MSDDREWVIPTNKKLEELDFDSASILRKHCFNLAILKNKYPENKESMQNFMMELTRELFTPEVYKLYQEYLTTNNVSTEEMYLALRKVFKGY